MLTAVLYTMLTVTTMNYDDRLRFVNIRSLFVLQNQLRTNSVTLSGSQTGRRPGRRPGFRQVRASMRPARDFFGYQIPLRYPVADQVADQLESSLSR